MAVIRFLRATRNTLDGIQAIWKREPAFRQEVYYTLLALPVIYAIPCVPLLKLLLIASFFLILATEIVNSAIESIVDGLMPGIHPEAKYAKDLGSAAVGIVILLNIILMLYALSTVVLLP